MSNLREVEFNEVNDLVKAIIQQVQESNWVPELIVGISRGGLLPAVMLSHYFDCPMTPLVWSTRDDDRRVSDTSLAEEAAAGKHILIVDDIIDSGITIVQIMEDWDLSVVQNIDWGRTTKVASLHTRHTSEYNPAYTADVITNKDWIVYPWEKEEF